MAALHLFLPFYLIVSPCFSPFVTGQTSKLPSTTLEATPTGAYLTTGFSTTGYPTTPPAGCYNSRCMDCLSSLVDGCTGFYEELVTDPTAELRCVCLSYDYCAMYIDDQASFSAFVSWRNIQCPTSFYPVSLAEFISPGCLQPTPKRCTSMCEFNIDRLPWYPARCKHVRQLQSRHYSSTLLMSSVGETFMCTHLPPGRRNRRLPSMGFILMPQL
jgi:hypothetical protein